MTMQSDMLTEMQADMGRSNTAAVLAMRNKIGAAIRQYDGTRFWFNEGRKSFSTVIGTDTYSFATIGQEFFKIDTVIATIQTGQTVELDRTDPRELEDWALNDTTTGPPSAYAYFNDGIRLWRNPDQVYSIEIMGHFQIAGPATDGEANNPWMNYAYDLIMCRAKAELFAHRWVDPVQAAVMVKAEQSALQSLQGDTADKFRSGFVTATEF